jgi:hypothetical protein
MVPPYTVRAYISKNNVPADVYIEVTGEILDGYPYHLPEVAIRVSSVRNVDDEVYAFLHNAERSCELWQRNNSARLAAQAHGGTVVPVWNFTHVGWNRTGIPNHERQCGLWAIDTLLPHKQIDMWWPERLAPHFSRRSSAQQGTTAALASGEKQWENPDLPEIKGAVDFGPGCRAPSVTYRPPDVPFDDPSPQNDHSYVLLDLTVTRSGLPVDIHVASGSGSASAATYAIRHLEAWRFAPAECHGEIVAMRDSIRMDFNKRPPNCPPNGCRLPEAPPNPAIIGLRVPDGLRMAVNGVPALPRGCVAPALIEKHDPVIHARDFAREPKGWGFAETIAGGYVEAEIVIDGRGRTGTTSGNDAAMFTWTAPSPPRYSYDLRRILGWNLTSWKWEPAVCNGLPVYALAHIRYDFHPSVNSAFAVTSRVTLGNSSGCEKLKLMDGPDPVSGIMGIKQTYLICETPTQ